VTDGNRAAGDDIAARRAPLDRHTLVWIQPCERERTYAVARDELRRDALRRWFANDWPLVVRRPDGPVRIDHVALGVPLPPSEGRHRLCFEVHNEAIGRISPPLALDKAALRLPRKWGTPLAELATRTQRCGVKLRVYGSMAWQALTGLDYVTAQSDVDLWWQPGDGAQLQRVLGIIARWEKRYGMPADGEIVFPSGAAVASREWRQQRSDDRVLVKRIGTLELVSRNALAAALRAGGQRCTA
jgi:phosphoribosyl-dephospho-CoA transferase